MPTEPTIFGIAGEFASPEALLAAAHAAHARGYRHVEGYSPFPVEGLAAALGFRRTRVPLLVLIGGAVGAGGAFFMQWYANVISYPWNVGGRPPNSWPAFIPVTFELGVLLAALAGVIGMLMLNGLPRPHHPIFNTPNFEASTRDRFFLCIERSDPLFDPRQLRQLLEEAGALNVAEVPR